MRPEEVTSDRSGRLIRLGEGDWAFAPHPLPPTLEFSPQLWRTLSEADRSLGELAGLGRTLPNPQILVQPFMRREAVLSSRIEGTRSNLNDVYAYEAGQFPLPGQRSPSNDDVREVVNYVHAMQYGLERLKTLPVSLRLIREIHERLMHGVRGQHAAPGEFRRNQNWIGEPGIPRNQALYTPPPAPEMERTMSDLERYLHEDCAYPPLVRLGFVHYQFEAIHPFMDGNGRTGRLLITLLLADWNLLPLPLLYLSSYFEEHRSAYYDHLLRVTREGAWENWLTFFLRGVAEQSQDAIQRAKRLQDLQQEWKDRFAGSRSSGALFTLIDALFVSPALTINQARDVLGISYPAAQNQVKKLVAQGILHEVGATPRGKTYLADEILRVTGLDLLKFQAPTFNRPGSDST